jgi:hypothetical protein
MRVPILYLFSIGLLLGCDQMPVESTEQTLSPAAGRSALYQLQFITETDQGEITSALFPANGVALNTRDPWKNLTVDGAALTLVNYTHGDWSICAPNPGRDVPVTWDIAGTDPLRSFAGNWQGEVKLWRSRGGLNLAFEGSRTDGAGAIRNVVTNNNLVYEERGEGDSYFLLRFTNARMGFGSLSTPDGGGSLGQLEGYEAACANLSLKATRIP